MSEGGTGRTWTVELIVAREIVGGDEIVIGSGIERVASVFPYCDPDGEARICFNGHRPSFALDEEVLRVVALCAAAGSAAQEWLPCDFPKGHVGGHGRQVYGCHEHGRVNCPECHCGAPVAAATLGEGA